MAGETHQVWRVREEFAAKPRMKNKNWLYESRRRQGRMFQAWERVCANAWQQEKTNPSKGLSEEPSAMYWGGGDGVSNRPWSSEGPTPGLSLLHCLKCSLPHFWTIFIGVLRLKLLHSF